jgi:hypothetical protein
LLLQDPFAMDQMSYAAPATFLSAELFPEA